MLHERKTRIELQFGVTIVTRASRCARSVGKSESCGLEFALSTLISTDRGKCHITMSGPSVVNVTVMFEKISPRASRVALRCHDMSVTFCRFRLRRHMSLVGVRPSRKYGVPMGVRGMDWCGHEPYAAVHDSMEPHRPPL